MADKGQDSEPGSKANWECGDEYYVHVVPGETENHWENLLLPLLESDKSQCEAWKDEVQNLLIFAGLFSGLLTSFLLQSYQSLQPDPNDAIISLLSQIANRLDNPVNGTSPPNTSTNSIPLSSAASASLIRINVFWFISLILSLTTVLVGIVSLQWLREHQQYATISSPRDKLGIFNMRAQALEAWHIPQIFAFLPILFQFSLALFLVGLPDFLLPLGPKVAIPVIIAIAIPLSFLVITTALPALQTFTFLLPFPANTTTVPSQCPYKSPQSLIFQRLVWTSQQTGEACLAVVVILNLFMIVLHSWMIVLHSWMIILKSSIVVFSRKHFPFFFRPAVIPNQTEEALDQREMMNTIVRSLKQSKWAECDRGWLAVRDFYAESISGRYPRMRMNEYSGKSFDGAIFDVTQALRKACTGDSGCHSAAYWAFRELSSFVKGLQYFLDGSPSFERQRRANQLLQKFIGYEKALGEILLTYSSLLEKKEQIDLSMVVDENAFLFLSNCSRTTPEVRFHFAELHIRLSRYLYTSKPRPLVWHGDQAPDMEKWADMQKITDQFWELDNRSFGTMKDWWWTTLSSDKGFSIQCSDVIKSYFQAIINRDITDDDIFNSFHFYPWTGLMRYAAILQSQDHIKDVQSMISTTLTLYLDRGDITARADFLFYASVRYADSLLHLSPSPNSPRRMDYFPKIEKFLLVLKSYWEISGVTDRNFGRRIGPRPFTDFWWKHVIDARGNDSVPNEEDKTKDAAPHDQTTNTPSRISHQDNTKEPMGAGADNPV